MSNNVPSQLNTKLEELVTGTTEAQRKITAALENNRTFIGNLSEKIRKVLELINDLKTRNLGASNQRMQDLTQQIEEQNNQLSQISAQLLQTQEEMVEAQSNERALNERLTNETNEKNTLQQERDNYQQQGKQPVGISQVAY